MYKNTVVASLTFVSILLTSVASTHAELTRDINPLTIQKIERSTTTTNDRSNQRQVATNSQQSMRYVQLGWAAQKRGNERQALIYYHKAVKLDQTNAVAFLAAGNLLGETEEGVTCIKAAVVLFQAQGNQEGYNIAVNWLEEHGVPYEK
jgi:cytochrome c-type biogenesis protein CcmH/NrfG